LTEVLQEFELLGGTAEAKDIISQSRERQKGGHFFNFEDFLTEDA
jgi:hypothetical protein